MCALGRKESGLSLAASLVGACTLNFCLKSWTVGGRRARAHTNLEGEFECKYECECECECKCDNEGEGEYQY